MMTTMCKLKNTRKERQRLKIEEGSDLNKGKRIERENKNEHAKKVLGKEKEKEMLL